MSCKTNKKQEVVVLNTKVVSNDFTIAFGSCNNQVLSNIMWSEILKNIPNVWIWGGDVIYTDTEDMLLMAQNYQKQKAESEYANFIKNVAVLGTWDDHDYGLNDGGIEYSKKVESQNLFLDFINVDKNDERRQQEVDSLAYPIIDFTSSGLTHSYKNFKGEPNQYRIEDVVFEKSFGILKFDFDKLTVTMQMRGEDNVLQQELLQSY